jgi:hypothetical protein
MLAALGILQLSVILPFLRKLAYGLAVVVSVFDTGKPQ